MRVRRDMVPPRGTRLRVSHVPVFAGWTSSQREHHPGGAPPPPGLLVPPRMDGRGKTSRTAKILLLSPSPSIICRVGMTQISVITSGDDFLRAVCPLWDSSPKGSFSLSCYSPWICPFPFGSQALPGNPCSSFPADLQMTHSSVPKMGLVPSCADSIKQTPLMRVQVLFLVLQKRKKDGLIYLDKNKNIKHNTEVWLCY